MGARKRRQPYGEVTLAVLKIMDRKGARKKFPSMAAIAKRVGTNREMVRQVLERWRPALYARYRRGGSR
jgi:DNA-binding IscR family transcriptional regulator